MKNLLPLFAILLVLSGCLKEPEYHHYVVKVNFALNDSLGLSTENIANAPVTFNNLNKNLSFTTHTDSYGNVVFDYTEPGFYNIQLATSFTIDFVKYYANGSGNISVFEDRSDTVEVVISITHPLVIKEYYYSGCLTPSGNAYSADQYIEIYNNSSDTMYADGLSLIEHESYDIEPYYFSWLKDTIVCRMIWTIPGEGTDYPIYPGKSIVLARDAFDHKSDSLGNPLCPVDLAHADFEFWVNTASGDDIDGAYSANLIEDLFTFRGSDICFHTRGGSAIALVQIPGNDAERKAFIANNLILKDDLTSTRYYGKIPNSFVIDAVEVVWDEAHAVYKRLPVDLDAGYTYNTEGAKSGLVLRRKVEEIVDGRVVYQDTNNSTEDFIKGTSPKPWIYE